MSDVNNKLCFIREGLKTFFIVPDVSLMPEEYLEDYFALGYECYIIDDDPYCPLPAKIEGLIATFNEVILFFFIDRKIQGIQWAQYIRALNKKYKQNARIGVLYTKRSNSQECRILEQEYLWDSELVCGCIPLEYQKTHNYLLIKKVLYANQANGRRATIRAMCNAGCTINFVYENEIYKADICDVSMTHFSCLFTQKPFDIPLYEKIAHISMVIKGQRLTVTAVKIFERVINEDTVTVFVFRNSKGFEGLDPKNNEKMLDVIYAITNKNIKELLNKLYIGIRKKLKEGNNE